jgi:hypothetical protein
VDLDVLSPGPHQQPPKPPAYLTHRVELRQTGTAPIK